MKYLNKLGWKLYIWMLGLRAEWYAQAVLAEARKKLASQSLDPPKDYCSDASETSANTEDS